jgi:hypothetical protein
MNAFTCYELHYQLQFHCVPIGSVPKKLDNVLKTQRINLTLLTTCAQRFEILLKEHLEFNKIVNM